MKTNLFEQYLREQQSKEGKSDYPFHEWLYDFKTLDDLIDYGNKAMEELSNGMNLEIDYLNKTNQK